MNLAQLYESITTAIQHETGAADSLLHVHAGLAVLLIARVLTGKPLGSAIPFLIVCVAALANEVLDRISHGVWRPWNTGFDLIQTLFWPLVLTIGARVRSSRVGKRALDDAGNDSTVKPIQAQAPPF